MALRTHFHGVLALLAMLASVATAQAQIFRAYLSIDGSDANPCTLPAPCRLLPAALNAVASGGEVWMLDSANYNTSTVTIGKSATILAVPGAVGSVVALGGPAIQITASGLEVALRNLVIVPFPGGSGTHGIQMTGASELIVENSLVANLDFDGMLVTGAGTLKVTNSIVRGNGGYAVRLLNGATGVISGSQLLSNFFGGVQVLSEAGMATAATVADSLISGGQEGVWSNSSGGNSRIFVTRCTIEGVDYALDSTTANVGVAVVAASGNTIVRNGFQWYVAGTGAVVESAGNNHFAHNSVQSGFLTPTGLQ